MPAKVLLLLEDAVNLCLEDIMSFLSLCLEI